MTNVLRSMLVTAGSRVGVPAFAAPRPPVVLTYHGVPASADARGMGQRVFEQHVLFLKRHFNIVSSLKAAERQASRTAIDVMLTFDDGFRNHAEIVAPILRRHHVPATFFVPSRHTVPGRYLWFAYLRMLEQYFPGNGFMFYGEFVDMSPGTRRSTMIGLKKQLLDLRPHPSAMYRAIDEELPRLEDFVDRADLQEHCAGMSVDQLEELAADPLFTIGAHTVDHPLLPHCDAPEQVRQIVENKRWLERVCKRSCDAIAYPGSDADATILRQCREAGFTAGYSDHRSIGADPDLEVPRVGIYYPSAAELGVKVRWSRVIAQVRNRGQVSLTSTVHQDR
jgi:peptidoglycan/xylan/chitin deacetylase (PgdA/CDA1 family)